ncbi:2-aminoethylphosphonate--pyruvate transaminase [Marinobacterium nitratireducens]|uniref:2-aminoethylphosphonate--pyruvate transaminase n=1 Tax=Marinobacterium nitratireducens TaxID=518897 RepID=A0A917ZFS0_9GAMM|nr:2-aminoethylphosphonate--pyruvate transaminase [Marinobacterium nitratireducens]GGO82296.1 2-aminoethylphosphonate--pyruvate transaminase [Marinobacterium nitratireducens]
MRNETVDPYLLTPGPITTSLTTKQAMLHDWGSWDADFNAMTGELCRRLLALANAEDSHVCVPVQGSGSFAVEATLGTLVPRDGKVLVLMNGAYGQRIGKSLSYMGRGYVAIDKGDYAPPSPEEVAEALAADSAISHVALVFCETSSGILNPVAEIAEVVKAAGRSLIIDAMSAFGALPVDAGELEFDALISAANKCIEGVPGFGYALIRRPILEGAEGNAHSLCLDLYDQWRYMERTGQWRFTPPTHVVAAFLQALREHEAEGGVAGRLARYTRNRDRTVAGLRDLGFRTLLEDRWFSPVITTFLSPTHANFDFRSFYDRLKAKGYIIYPGKLTQAESFRIGHIGQLHDVQIDGLLAAVTETLDELQVDLHL